MSVLPIILQKKKLLASKVKLIPPTSLSIAYVSSEQIDLSWTLGDATKAHRIYISTDNVTFVEKGTVPAGVDTFSATVLTNYTRYYFKVVAYQGTVESLAATADTFTLYAFDLEATGTGAGVSTLRLESSANITLTATGNVKFYDDSGGTTNEGTERTVTSGALRTFFLKCTSGTGKILVSDNSKLTSVGNVDTSGWDSGTNAAKITMDVSKISVTTFSIAGNSQLNGGFSESITGSLRVSGNNINWTYTGALPSGVSGWLVLSGNNINWTYTGALPSGVSGWLVLDGANINWTYTGALLSGITGGLWLSGANINWTGLNVGNGNITAFNLGNYRIAKMSSDDMVTFLTHLKDRTGSLPNTITINDYADFASPPQSVIDAVAALKVAKPNITTVNLGA